MGNLQKLKEKWFGKPKNTMKGFWEDRFDELAIYNAERSQGLVHTAGKDYLMEKLKKEYNAKLKAWEKCSSEAGRNKFEIPELCKICLNKITGAEL